jgi:hypothetical protein
VVQWGRCETSKKKVIVAKSVKVSHQGEKVRLEMCVEERGIQEVRSLVSEYMGGAVGWYDGMIDDLGLLGTKHAL